MDLFEFIPLEVHSVSWVCVFYQILETFNHFFFQYSFSPTSFHLSFWASNDMSIRSLFIDPQVMFFTSVLSLFFRLGEFQCSLLQFTDSILCHLHCTIESSSNLILKVSAIIFSVMEFPFGSFFNNFYFFAAFLFFHLFQDNL